ncbi:MAG: biopolymer transporter ExbD [Pseudomonadota bacterium]
MAGLRLPPRQPSHAPDSSLAIINIVLLLIFFFLTTGSLLNSDAVELALPETTRLDLDQLPQPLLYVDADGIMTLGETVIAPGTLNAALTDAPRLHVLADRELSAALLLQMLADERLVAVEVRLVTVHNNAGEAGS